MDTLFIDLRAAVRGLLKRPGFTLVAVLTLAVGIGASTTMFTLLYRVVLRPLPYGGAERLVFLNETNDEGTDTYSVTIPNFFDWRERNRSFDELASFRAHSFNHTGRGEPERIRGAMVSGNFFETLHVSAALGNTLEAADDDRTGTPPVVLSHALWQRRFGGERTVLGQTMHLDGRDFFVRGVMPPTFSYLSTTIEMWMLMSVFRDELPWEVRGRHPAMWVVGRLSEGVTLEAARADMTRISIAIEEEFGHATRIAVTSLHERIVGRAQPAFVLLMAGVALLLLIACANVANLLIARAAGRRSEMATRAALGASRGRLVRQLLTESVLLASVGGAIGLLSSSWGVALLQWMLPRNTPRLLEVEMDLTAALFAVAVSAVTGVIFGLAPAAHVLRRGLDPTLRQSGGVHSDRSWLRGALVVAETAIAVVLLVGAGLLLQTVHALARVDAGFEPDNRVAARFSLSPKRFETREASIDFYQRVLEEVGAIAGVSSVSVATGLPLVSPGHESTIRPAQSAADPERGSLVSFQVVSPGYFETMGIPLLRGRTFDARDGRSSPRVAVIDESLARQLFPGEDPIGRSLLVDGSEDAAGSAEIVGVVRHVLNYRLTAPRYMEVYVPLEQPPDWMTGPLSLNLVVRSAASEDALVPELRRRLADVDPLQPIYGVTTLSGVMREAAAPQRLNGTLFGVFAAVALFLASVGIYGVVSSLVSQSVRAIAVRMAFGASPARILGEILARGLTMTAIGLLVGIVGALVGSRLIESLIVGVSPFQPETYVGVAAVLLVVATVACAVPAIRATKVQVIEALRCE